MMSTFSTTEKVIFLLSKYASNFHGNSLLFFSSPPAVSKCNLLY